MVYINNKKFIQFELWKDCTIGCKFCCNKGQPKTDKLLSLSYINSILDSKDIYFYDEIGFIGGEIFNSELEDNTIKNKFYAIFDKVSKLNFEKIYIATSLIFDISKYLLPFIEYMKKINILDKVIICTSFDVKYRFHTNEMKELWKKNMLYLKSNFKELRLHTEIILTEWFLNAVLKDEFDIKAFEKVFKTSIDYIEPSSGLYYKDKNECEKACPGFFPKKSTFVKFITKCIKNNLINIDTFLSMELRSNTLYFIENNNYRVATERRLGDGRCELSDKTKNYDIGFIDSDKKMIDIAKIIYSTIYN